MEVVGGGLLAALRQLADYWRDAYIVAERRPSGIAGWRGGFIAQIGSEGTRDALLFASPVPERRITVEFERTTDRPAISCTALFALFDSWSDVASYLACVWFGPSVELAGV
jgi:hypothetical protein